MSLGLRMAAEALGLDFQPLAAADMAGATLDVYQHNLRPNFVFDDDLSRAITYRVAAERVRDVDVRARSFANAARGVDVLIGGPPCQGHSDLNNHSRRDDPKNSLYLVMPAMALALDPRVVIVENVPAVVHDRSGVVEATVRTLREAGYRVTLATIPMVRVGVPQRRKRHFLIAVRGPRLDLEATVAALSTSPRPMSWAVDDVQDPPEGDVFESPSKQSEENRRRIEWLFANAAFDLPNPKRPSCHRDKEHSYVSMYGRMRWNESAQTITSGFGSPGQGRYIHARRRRTITPHEAARLQFFPDSFRFDGLSRVLHRTELAVMIGNAVPPKASYVLGLAAMASVGNTLKE